MKPFTPIPQNPIGESFVWREWFQRISDKVFGDLAGQNSDNVNITGGSIQNVNFGVTSVIAGRGIVVSSATGDVTISQSLTTTKNYGAFSNTTTQTAAAATATAITFDTTDLSSGVSRGSPTSRIVITNAGIYNIQFSAQLSNTSAQIDDVTIWLRKNGSDVAYSAGLVGSPAKHGSINGHIVAGWNYVVQAAASDYFQLYWTTDSGDSSILTYPASGSAPVHPASPSMILTVQQV